MFLLIVALQNFLSAQLWIIRSIKTLLSRQEAFESLICLPWLSIWSICDFCGNIILSFLDRSTVLSASILLIVGQF